MLNAKQKRYLKSLAMKKNAIYQIGKKEITNNSIIMLDKALIAHELIKISVLKSIDTSLMEIALDLSSKLNAEVVQIIGRVIVLYRANEEKSIIKLP